jgi:hypothetical protein
MNISHISYIELKTKINISTCSEYPLLCDKAVLGKSANHPTPSLRAAQIFPTLKLTYWSLNKVINASVPSDRGPLLLLLCCFLLLFLSFLSIKFCYRFAICVSIQFSVQVTQSSLFRSLLEKCLLRLLSPNTRNTVKIVCSLLSTIVMSTEGFH